MERQLRIINSFFINKQRDYEYQKDSSFRDCGGYRIQENSDWGSAKTRWKELETTAENLKKLVEGINKTNKSDRKLSANRKPSGFLLYDPAGKQVGILYVKTNKYYQPRIRVFEGERVNIVATVYVGPRLSAR